MKNMTSTDQEAVGLRYARFTALAEKYEAEGPDASVPGASLAGPVRGRYAVLTESHRGQGHFLSYAETLRDVETVAAANLSEGWDPVAYFDLDELAGEEPYLEEGDRVRYGDEEFFIVDATDNLAEGEVFWTYWLDKEEDAGIGSAQYQNIDRDSLDVIECATPDPRLPVRYEVAKIFTSVIFNTVASS